MSRVAEAALRANHASTSRRSNPLPLEWTHPFASPSVSFRILLSLSSSRWDQAKKTQPGFCCKKRALEAINVFDRFPVSAGAEFQTRGAHRYAQSLAGRFRSWKDQRCTHRCHKNAERLRSTKLHDPARKVFQIAVSMKWSIQIKTAPTAFVNSWL